MNQYVALSNLDNDNLKLQTIFSSYNDNQTKPIIAIDKVTSPAKIRVKKRSLNKDKLIG